MTNMVTDMPTNMATDKASDMVTDISTDRVSHSYIHYMPPHTSVRHTLPVSRPTSQSSVIYQQVGLFRWKERIVTRYDTRRNGHDWQNRKCLERQSLGGRRLISTLGSL